MGQRVPLFHAYGPTEATITALLDTAPLDRPELPLGRPLANMRAYVLDRDGQPVPVGVQGELHLAGVGLARGYVNRSDLTEAAFVRDPFSRDGSGRLYRTGDRVRYLPDGRLVFMGRVDQQVKIRGFRVEPGEIETALRRHPSLQDAIVTPQDDRQGRSRLVAYVVLKADQRDSDGTETVAQVDQWQDVYDEIYRQNAPEPDASFNTVGWNSTYTGLPLGLEAMREQVDGTVERILALPHERVLEIGCGTGLLLFRVAPHCRHYTATDFSPVALDYVRRHASLPHLTLREQRADDFTGLEPGSFSAIVVNSVVQALSGRGVPRARAGRRVAVSGARWRLVSGGHAKPAAPGGLPHVPRTSPGAGVRFNRTVLSPRAPTYGTGAGARARSGSLRGLVSVSARRSVP